MLLSALYLALISATASVSATGSITNEKRNDAPVEKRQLGYVPEFGASHWEGGSGFRTFPAKAVSKRSKAFGKREGEGAFVRPGT